MFKIKKTQDSLKLCRRRLQMLKEKQAEYGISISPSILVEIEDMEVRIGELETELATQLKEIASNEGELTINISGSNNAYIKGSVDIGGGTFIGRDRFL